MFLCPPAKNFTFPSSWLIMQITCTMRTNIYKEKILSLLKKKHLLTIADIHKAIPEADYSTVFRNVEQLLKNKEVKKVMIDNKSVAYELSHGGHDHFICTECGVVESIHVPRTSIKGHTVEDVTVRGSCQDCAQ